MRDQGHVTHFLDFGAHHIFGAGEAIDISTLIRKLNGEYWRMRR